MKLVFGLLVLVAIVLVGVYYFGGVRSFDPNKIGNDIKARIKPGMAWTEVVAIAPQPRSYGRLQPEGPAAPDQPVRLKLFKGPYDRETIGQHIAAGQVADGFTLEYFFTAQVAFEVWFDRHGVVDRIEDVATMADLLDMRKKQP